MRQEIAMEITWEFVEKYFGGDFQSCVLPIKELTVFTAILLVIPVPFTAWGFVI